MALLWSNREISKNLEGLFAKDVTQKVITTANTAPHELHENVFVSKNVKHSMALF